MRLFSRFDSSSFSFSKIKSLSLLLLMPSIGMAVTTWNVDSNEDSDTWTSGHRTLRGALTRAAAGDTITLTALAGDTITLTNNLPSISYSVTIQGTGDPVSIDGTNTYHMFNIASGTVSLSNLHLENAIITGSSGGSSGISSGMNSGGGLGAGAALFVGTEANVVLSDVSFENNRAVGGSGGGYNGVATTTGGAGASFQLTAGPTATTLGQMDAFAGQFGQGGAGGNGSTAPLAGGMGGFGAGGGDSGIGSAGIGGISSGDYGGIGGNGGALANGSEWAPGGDGAGLGGAIFVQPEGALTVARSTSFSSNTTIGGSAGVNSLSHSMGALDGGTAGNDLFLGSSSTLILDASSGDLVMENAIAGYNGNLVKSGSGEALLTGLNTYSGNTTIQAGALGINSGGCLSTGPVTFSGINASTLRLYADGQVLASNMVFNAGFADFDLQNNTTTLTGLMSGTGALNLIGDGSTLILAGTVNNTYAGGTFLNPGSTLSVGTEGALGAGDLSLHSATLTWRNSIATEKNLTLLSDSSINVQSNNITMLGTATGTGALTKLGSGKLILSGSNNYSGGTIVAAGTLQVASDTALGSGDLTLDNATILQWDGAASSSKALTLSGTATIHTGTYSVAMSGATRGTGSLNKNGSGTLTLTGSSSYSGGTTVMAGTLAASSDAALGTGSAAIADGSTLQWTRDTTSSKALSLSGTATIGIGTGVTVTMSGTATGSASLTKEGAGLLILTGSNSYSAGTHLVAGTLGAATDAALGSGNLSFEGGDLQWSNDTSSAKAFALLSSANIDTGNHNVTMSGIGSGTGRLTKIGLRT